MNYKTLKSIYKMSESQRAEVLDKMSDEERKEYRQFVEIQKTAESQKKTNGTDWSSWFIGAAVIIIMFVRAKEGKIMEIGTIILVLIPAAILYYLISRPSNRPEPPVQQEEPKPVQKPVQAAAEAPSPAVTQEFSGYEEAYRYDDVDIAGRKYRAKDTLMLCGYDLDLVQEPENEHDENAIAVYYDGEKVGFLHQNRIQAMANDYLDRGWPVTAVVEDDDGTTATMTLTFYKKSKKQ